MSSSDIPSSPLGSIWQHIHGGVKPTRSKHNIQNWLRLVIQLQDVTDRERLRATLSTPQWIALLVLEEWWNNNDKDEEITSRDRQTIESGRKPESLSAHPYDYYGEMIRLWKEEFYWYRERSGDDDGATATVAAQIRQSMVPIAAAHRLAKHCYHVLVMQEGASEYLGPVIQQRLGRGQSFTESSIPASIGGCLWLDTTPGHSIGYPHYLWDIQQQKTVAVATYQTCPEYAAVSHTWGRWRLGQWKAVPGVPWSLPCNSLFDVLDLPGLLSGVSLPVKHLWFDLVCIPQSDEEKSFPDIAKSEIARQAEIFASAKYTVAWLNHINDWNQLKHAISWLSLSYLKLIATDAYPIIADLYAIFPELPGQEINLAVKAGPQTPAGILWHHVVSSHEETWEPCGWFTSLWTLQEICMRPRMWLCSRNWDVFSVENRPVALDDIVALLATVEGLVPPRELRRQPREVRGLYRTFLGAGLLQLLPMTRIGILVAGTRKYCEKTRAEAIMSALGCTRWYRQQKDEETSSANAYPLSFVHECQLSMGAAFFSVFDGTIWPKDTFQLDKQGRLRDVKRSASMIPFIRPGHNCKSFVAESTQLMTRDHPSVATWIIDAEGHVHIKEAGITASWLPQNKASLPELKVNILTVIDDDEPLYENVDINVWLGSFRPESEKHAVWLLAQPSHGLVHGVLLERIYNDAEQHQVEDAPASRFFKFGIFLLSMDGWDEDYESPPTTEVDWLVI